MKKHNALLRSFQRLLSAIYDVPVQADIADFIVTDRRQLPAKHRHTPTDEQVLVALHGDTLEISVYLDAGMLERLARANPLQRLHGDNVADYWTALEGVSHFLYLAWNAGHDRPVTLLELELQAEIDKYVTSLWLLKRQQPQRFPVELHHLLFERSRIEPSLARERIAMYATANYAASRFCRRLAQRLDSSLSSVRLESLAELRRFYRLNHQRKFRHIEHRTIAQAR
jgi:hypothetical protein